MILFTNSFCMAELAAGAAIHSSAGVPDGDKQKPYLVARDVEGATYQDSLDGLKVYSKKLKHEGLFEYSGLDMADDILSRNQKYIHKVIGAGEIAGGITMQAGGMLGSMPSGGASLFAIGAGGVMTVSGHSKMAGRYESSEGAAVLRSFAEPTGSYYFHSMGEAVAYDTLAASVGGKVLEGAVRLSAKTFAPKIKATTRETILETHAATKATETLADGASVRPVTAKVIREDAIVEGSKLEYLAPGRLRFDGVEFRAVRNLGHLSERDLTRMVREGVNLKDLTGVRLDGHHYKQQYHREPGAFIIEIPDPAHSISNKVQHPLGTSGGLTREQRADWNSVRKSMNKERARTELLKRKKDQ